MKIARIIRAKLKNKDLIEDSWYKERLKICSECPFNSKNTKENKNFKYKFWEFLNLKKPFCTICGCEIEAKASEEMEICSLVEINQKAKWEPID